MGADHEPRCDAVPVLPVADLTRALAFYERLGFVVHAHHLDDGYALLDYDHTEVHLAENPSVSAAGSLSGVYLRVPDADVVHRRWMAMGAREVAPLADTSSGVREFATEDLDGNLWRVGAIVGGARPARSTPDADDADFDSLLAEHAVYDQPTRPLPRSTAPATLAAIVPPDPATAEPRAVGPAADPPADGSPGTPDEQWLAIVAGEERCAGCGMDPAALPARALGAEVRDDAHSLAELLRAAPDDLVRYQPAPGAWSALEYGVHVRDLLGVFADRIIRTLRQDDPELGWWDHEEAMADGMANESDVDAVADDIGRNAAKLSEALRLVTDDDWGRRARRRGDRFTIELLARYTLHEVDHHLADARRALGII